MLWFLLQSFPLPFCKTYLPDEDEMFTLIDESGDEWQSKYLARKNGLSGGWRGFSIDHELVDGDALVFQLIEPSIFKVTFFFTLILVTIIVCISLSNIIPES